MSHDLADVVTVVDGRPALIDELRGAPGELRTYIAKGDFVASYHGPISTRATFNEEAPKKNSGGG